MGNFGGGGEKLRQEIISKKQPFSLRFFNGDNNLLF